MSTQKQILAARKRLRGGWRSDKKRTMERWVFPPKLSVGNRRKIASLFGKTIWQFDAVNCTGRFEDLRWKSKYTILWADQHSAVVLFKVGKEERCHQLYFEANHFYLIAGKSGNVEYFTRMPSN